MLPQPAPDLPQPPPPEEQGLPRFSIEQLELLFVYLVRNEQVFLRALSVLMPEHLCQPPEACYRELWVVLVELHNRYRVLPQRQLLESTLVSRVRATTWSRGEDIARSWADFFSWVWDVDVAAMPAQVGYDLLHQFLHEREVFDPLRRLLVTFEQRVPGNMVTLVNDLSDRSRRVQAVAGNPVVGLLPGPGEREVPIERFSTNVAYFDEMVGGGLGRREVSGLLGGLSSGKTSVANWVSVSVALGEALQAECQPGYEPEHVFFVGYEQHRNDYRRLALAAVTDVDKDRYTFAPGWLDGLDTVHPAVGVPSERARFDANVPRLERCWHLVDMSGTDPDNPGLGCGYFDELCAHIEREVRDRRCKVKLIVIDFLQNMIERHVAAAHLDPSKHTRHLVNSAGDICKRQLAARFNCAVLLLHQLSGQANERKPTAKVGHANAAEGKHFAKDLVNCLELGMKDPKESCVLLWASKTRHAATPPTPKVLRYTAFGKLLDASSDYYLDVSAGQLSRRNHAATFAAGGSGARGRPEAPEAEEKEKAKRREPLIGNTVLAPTPEG